MCKKSSQGLTLYTISLVVKLVVSFKGSCLYQLLTSPQSFLCKSDKSRESIVGKSLLDFSRDKKKFVICGENLIVTSSPLVELEIRL